jgi:hypothetical protein
LRPPPGATLKASHWPSGDHVTNPTGSSNAVTNLGKPPVEGMVQTCGLPLRFDTKTRRVPSGENLGDQDAPILAINATDRSRSSAAAVVPAVTRNGCIIGQTLLLKFETPMLSRDFEVFAISYAIWQPNKKPIENGKRVLLNRVTPNKSFAFPHCR